MKNINMIIAAGILAQQDITEKLALVVEANQRLAQVLCGDIPKPSEEDTLARVVTECEKNNRQFLRINEVSLDSDFRWRAHVTYSYTKYGKTLDASRYDCKSAETEEYNIPLSFCDDMWINLC